MCGIAGIATREGLLQGDEQLLDAMLLTLQHRGPDDHQSFVDRKVAIGARRLSIIDLDTGRQPLSNEDGTIWATQNGEIYNYVELRDRLQALGHRFKSKGDTEVITHAYEEYGTDFPRHLRGMFAIALWDVRKQRLLLVRDRLGKKPIYWRRDGGRLAYGSELKALLADSETPRRLDHTALALYLQYQYVPAPHTIFADIYKLPPASWLCWDGNEPTVATYWSPSYEPKREVSREQGTEELLDLLRDSVRLRLRSDVPIGVFLSGGMDSSVVTALMVEASNQPVHTYSIGFTEEAYNELPYARAVAAHLGTDHTDDVVTIDAIDLLPKLAYHYDEPFGDPSAMPTYRVAELAAPEIKVVLTGDGGDESFGGYGRYLAARRLRGLASMPGSRPIADLAELALRGRVAPKQLRLRSQQWRRLVRMTADERYVRSMSVIRPEVLVPLLCRAAGSDNSSYLATALSAGPDDPIDRLLSADLHTYLPEDLLVKMDRATMAHSLEARSPLLDHVVVEYAAKLPSTRKIAGANTKLALRDVALKLLPSSLIERPKMGFGIPMREWFQSSLGDVYTDLVLSPNSAIKEFIDTDVASDLLAAHRNGNVSHAHALWELLMLEQWARTWLRR